VCLGSLSRRICDNYWYMSLEEIEAAIRSLDAEEFARIAERFHALEQERWDAEMDRDAGSGKLDFLISEAIEDLKQGRLIEWPPAE
jgi:hypothetical protein